MHIPAISLAHVLRSASRSVSHWLYARVWGPHAGQTVPIVAMIEVLSCRDTRYPRVLSLIVAGTPSRAAYMRSIVSTNRGGMDLAMSAHGH